MEYRAIYVSPETKMKLDELKSQHDMENMDDVVKLLMIKAGV